MDFRHNLVEKYIFFTVVESVSSCTWQGAIQKDIE